MLGYTSSGAGTSGAPVRFGCHGEVVLFELNQGSVTSWDTQEKRS